MRGGTSVTFLKKRLADVGRLDLLAAVADGQISAYAAAEAAGLITRPPTAGTGNQGPAKRRQFTIRRLTQSGPDPASEAMELILGPSLMLGSLFATREELRAAWERHREALLQQSSPGRRPAGYYEFEWPHGPRPRYDVERSTLWRSGLLSDEEKAGLEHEWRREFEARTAA
jgi:hypothetical protein